ncbi:MAG: acyl-CoA dehydrogenase, partial [Pseudomonadota bacterium]
GGLEFSAFAHSQVVMKLSSRSITAAVTTMVPNSLGPGKLLLHYGTQAQRDYYLPRLARAEEIPCFALTGPRAGSDAGATPDEGVVCHGQWKGKRILGIRLNWDKRYITLGPVATLIGLAFRLKDPDGLLGNRRDLGITVALVPRDLPGVDNGPRHVTLDIPFQNGPTRGHNVFVPLTQVIGEREGIGHGWRMLMESLAEGRGISLPALSVGAGKSASRYTGAYARVRRQFNMAIGHFEGIEEALARIAGFTYQMDAARSLTLAALDCGHKPSVLSAIVKYHLTERYRRVINDAMDIQAGSGICLGPANLIGRAYQAIPIAVTVEGANILTRSLIIFGQGAIRCHPWVLKEFNAVNESDRTRGLNDFDAALVGHVGYLAGNLARSLWLGLTRGRGSRAPVGGATQRYFQHLNWMSAAFALCGDVAMMTLGGSLKRREHLSARLGDVLSQLYLSSAVLKRYHDQGSPPSDLPLLDWAMQDSLYRIQERLRALFRNLPFAPLGWLLNRMVFPTGNPYAAPDDASVKAAARVLLAPSPARDRLTEGVFVSRDPGEAVGRLELALEQAVALESVEKTLMQARHARQIRGYDLLSLAADAHDKGLIETKAFHALNQLENLRDQVIAVDTFDSYGEQFLTRHEHRLDAA